MHKDLVRAIDSLGPILEDDDGPITVESLQELFTDSAYFSGLPSRTAITYVQTGTLFPEYKRCAALIAHQSQLNGDNHYTISPDWAKAGIDELTSTPLPWHLKYDKNNYQLYFHPLTQLHLAFWLLAVINAAKGISDNITRYCQSEAAYLFFDVLYRNQKLNSPVIHMLVFLGLKKFDKEILMITARSCYFPTREKRQ